MASASRLSLALALCALTVARAAPASEPLLPYDGKFAGDARMEALQRDAPALYRAALARLEERLGLRLEDPGLLLLELRDAQAPAPARLTRFRKAPFQTSTVVEAGVRRARVVFHAEYLMNGSLDLPRGLTHELTHALMRVAMEPRDYARVPKWLREGLAVWAADQLPDRLVTVLSSARLRWRPERAFPGLEVGRHDLDRYPESALAVDFMARRCGADGLRAFVAELLGGRPYRAALEARTGLDWEAFKAAARAHAFAVAKARAPAGVEAFCSLQELRQQRPRRFAEELAACQELLSSERFDGRLRRLTRYFYGYALARSKRDAEAAVVLREASLGDAPFGGHPYSDDAWFCFGGVLARLDRHAAAARAYGRMLAEHPHSPLLGRALFGRAEARRQADDRDGAIADLRALSLAFAKDPLTERARRALEALGAAPPEPPEAFGFTALSLRALGSQRLRIEVATKGPARPFFIYLGGAAGPATSVVEVDPARGRFVHLTGSVPGTYNQPAARGKLARLSSGGLRIELVGATAARRDLRAWAYCQPTRARLPEQGRRGVARLR